MKTYLSPAVNAHAFYSKVISGKKFLPLLLMLISLSGFSQELIFQNSRLKSGAAGQDGTVYVFPSVSPNVDALVTINGRSSSKVKLSSIDLTNTGFNKAFQPQVTYNNDETPDGDSNWWMEFQIKFVKKDVHTDVSVTKFDVTALDIDGNDDKINEWVSFYNLKSYILESHSDLDVSNLLQDILNLLSPVVGKKFEGPRKNYKDIDTTATRVMTTNKYQNTNTFKLRVGGHSTGRSGAANRMYSMWFKSFEYDAPVETTLPLILNAFDARFDNKKTTLSWSSSQEKNFSHYVVERSFDGREFNEIAIVFGNNNNDVRADYSYTDNVGSSKGIIYYRLKMVDLDKRSKYSAVRIIRIGEEKEALSILTYPNPVTNELRITIPASWQNKSVSFDLYNANGQVVKRIVNNQASQTQTVNVTDMAVGIYIVKASNGVETATQRIVKSGR